MEIKLEIDHGLLAEEIVKRLRADFDKLLAPAPPSRWTRADIKAFIGCGDTKLAEVLAHPKFPAPAGTGRLRTWDRQAVENFWLGSKIFR